MSLASQPEIAVPFIPGPKPNEVTLSTTSLVTSLIVRSPVTSKESSPVFFHDLLLKVIAGNLATSKKSADCRCLSRSGLAVLIEATNSDSGDDPSGATVPPCR